MVKILFLCRRRPDISHARYADLLLGGHAPLALRHHPTLRQYVINVVETSPVGAAPLDSVGELYFDTLEDFRLRLYDSPEGERMVAADVARFMGGAMAYVVGEEILRPAPRVHPLGTRTPGTKLVVCLRRPPAVTATDFATSWRSGARARLGAADRQPAGLALNPVRESLGQGCEPWDGFEILHAGTEDAGAPGSGALAPEREPAGGAGAAVGVAVYRVAEYVQRIAGPPMRP
jgi:uncharacterized protein (TIGR02118 family)